MPRFVCASLSRLGSLLFVLLALLLALPVLAVLASWLQWTPQTADLLLEMASTVLPDYAATSAALCLMVAVGVTLLGLGTAATVTLFDFRGRAVFEHRAVTELSVRVRSPAPDGVVGEHRAPVVARERHVEAQAAATFEHPGSVVVYDD